tara:strand:+ start:636 stop:1139 length:504 start_codon:yes stop_codon:yes gene_type:complete
MINEQIINSTLSLSPSDLTGDIDNIIKERLKSEFEGKCHDNGFIIRSSLSVIKRSVGSIETHNNLSSLKYNITFKAKIISPNEGDVIECFVSNINKMGILAYIKIGGKNDDGIESSPLIIIIPRNYFDEQSSKNIDDLTKNQSLNVRVVGVRTKYKSDKIQVVAKPL